MTLSVIVITRNEQASIRRCIESAAWANEIVVLDAGSTDETARIARECGAQVQVSADWPGFGAQKNRVLDLATGDWGTFARRRRMGHARITRRNRTDAGRTWQPRGFPTTAAVELLRTLHAPLGLVA